MRERHESRQVPRTGHRSRVGHPRRAGASSTVPPGRSLHPTWRLTPQERHSQVRCPPWSGPPPQGQVYQPTMWAPAQEHETGIGSTQPSGPWTSQGSRGAGTEIFVVTKPRVAPKCDRRTPLPQRPESPPSSMHVPGPVSRCAPAMDSSKRSAQRIVSAAAALTSTGTEDRFENRFADPGQS